MKKFLITLLGVATAVGLYAGSQTVANHAERAKVNKVVSEKAAPEFHFTHWQESYHIYLGSYVAVLDYFEFENVFNYADDVEWSFTPVGNSPVDGIEIEILNPKTYIRLFGIKDGEYILKAYFPGNDEIEAGEVTYKVVSGDGIPGGSDEKITPTLYFSTESVTYDLDVTRDIALSLTWSDINSDDFEWSFTPVGDSPADGIVINKQSFGTVELTTVKNGEYIVKVHYPGNDKFEEADAQITVISGTGAPSTPDPVEKVDPTFGFAEKSVTVTEGDVNVGLGFEANVPAGEIVWAVSPQTGLVLNGDGTFNAVATGTYTVTATFGGNDTYNEANASMLVTVEEKSAVSDKKTQDFVFTQEELRLNIGDWIDMRQRVIGINDVANVDFNLLEFVIEPIGNSPADGIVIDFSPEWAYSIGLEAKKDGEYIVKAVFSESYEYAAAEKSIKVISGAGAPSTEKVDPTFGFAETSINVTEGDVNVGLGFEANVPAGDIVWTVSPQTGLVLNGDGTFNAVAAGTYIVTATFGGNYTYNEANASMTVNVEAQQGSDDRLSHEFHFNKDKIECALGRTSVDIYLNLVCNDDISGAAIQWSFQPVGGSPEDGIVMNLTQYPFWCELTFKAEKDGEYIIKAYFPGDENYVPAEDTIRFISGAGAPYTEKADPTFGFAEKSVTVTEGDENINLNFTTNVPADEVAWTVDPSEGLVRNADGTFNAEAEGTYTVTAKFDGNDEYNEATASVTVVVEAQEVPGPGEKVDPTFGFTASEITVTEGANFSIGGKMNVGEDLDSDKIEYYLSMAVGTPDDGAAINNGMFYAYKPGVYEIEAKYAGDDTYNEKTATLKVTVNAKAADAPYLSIVENSAISHEDIHTLKVYYPEDYSFNAWTSANPMGKKVGYTVGYLKKTTEATSTGTNVADYMLTEIDEANRVLTLTLKDKHNAELPSGYYCVNLVANLFVKKSFFNFVGYELTSERLSAGFNFEEEIEIHAVDPNAENAEARKVELYHHEAYGATPDVHYHISLVSIAPHSDYEFDTDNDYNVPVVTFGNTQNPAMSHIGIVASTAGVYELNVKIPGSLLFEAEEAKTTVVVRPTIESLGLKVNDEWIALNYDGEYAVTFVADEGQTAEFGFGNLYSNPQGAKVWYKVTDAAPASTNKVEARNVSTDGYTLFGAGDSLDLNQIVGPGQKSVLSVILEQNNVVSAPQTVTLTNNGSSTAVETVGASNGDVKWYDLQGQAVANPENGVYIRVEGGKAVKVVR